MQWEGLLKNDSDCFINRDHVAKSKSKAAALQTRKATALELDCRRNLNHKQTTPLRVVNKVDEVVHDGFNHIIDLILGGGVFLFLVLAVFHLVRRA